MQTIARVFLTVEERGGVEALLVGDSVTPLSVALCPVTAFPEGIVLPVRAYVAPNKEVSVGDSNRLIVLGERDGELGISGESVGYIGRSVELAAPVTVTSTIILGTVDDSVQFCLILYCEDVLSH